MKPVVFRGSGCALITPMTQDGEISYDVLGKLIEYQIVNGTSALIVCATTGESSTLTDVEYASLIRFTKETAKGRVPVIAGCGTNSTQTTIEKCRTAEKMGADALLTVVPYYNRPDQKGLIKHFSKAAASTALPIIIYDVPLRTGTSISPEALSRLADIENIVGIKYASADLVRLLKAVNLCKEKLAIYSGTDELTVPIFSLGGSGVISAAANLYPGLFNEMCAFGLKHDFKAMLKKQSEILPVLFALSEHINPVSIKAAMNIAGIDAGGVRLPLSPLSEEEIMLLKSRIKFFLPDLDGCF